MLGAIGWVGEGPTARRAVARGRAGRGYLAVVVTSVAFLLWYAAVAGLGPARAGLLTGMAPIAAAAAGAMLGGPLPGPVVWAGIALVALGLAFGTRDGAARRVRDRA